MRRDKPWEDGSGMNTLVLRLSCLACVQVLVLGASTRTCAAVQQRRSAAQQQEYLCGAPAAHPGAARPYAASTAGCAAPMRYLRYLCSASCRISSELRRLYSRMWGAPGHRSRASTRFSTRPYPAGPAATGRAAAAAPV